MQFAAVENGKLYEIESLSLKTGFGYAWEWEDGVLKSETCKTLQAHSCMFLMRFDHEDDWTILDDSLCYTGYLTDRQLRGLLSDAPKESYEDRIEQVASESL